MHSIPYNPENTWAYSSFTIFVTAYGEIGLPTTSSRRGDTVLSPYVEDEAAYTTRLIPASRAAVSTFSVPVTFTAFVTSGSAIERGTDPNAA